MNLAIKKEDMQKQMMEDRKVLQNFLNIPVIELEQLNPRVRCLHGVQTVKYRSKGGDVLDDETSLEYEYDWVGGEIVFVDNPYPRPPVGTGRVALVPDDSKDPTGNAIALPEGCLSGSISGWNLEFLASHYLENYWKIIDEEYEKVVQERCFNILCNRGKSEDEAKAKVAESAELQAKGSPSMVVNVRRITTIPQTFTRKVTPEQNFDVIENHPIFKQMQQQNEEMRKMIEKLAAKNAVVADEPEPKKEPNGKKASGKKAGEKKGLTKEQRMENFKRGREAYQAKMRKEKELTGNLAG